MSKFVFAASTLVALTVSANAGLIITGVIDGPLSGGTPKAIELYATSDIADLSIYGIESANNGNAPAGEEYTFSGSASAGDYFWIASDAPNFNAFFGFDPTDTSGALFINGDDAMVLYENGSIIDTYGVAGVDGTGEVWDHLDSYAYRVDGTGPNTTFDAAEWDIPGTNVLDGMSVNGDNGIFVPFGTYVPEPASIVCLALGALAVIRRR